MSAQISSAVPTEVENVTPKDDNTSGENTTIPLSTVLETPAARKPKSPTTTKKVPKKIAQSNNNVQASKKATPKPSDTISSEKVKNESTTKLNSKAVPKKSTTTPKQKVQPESVAGPAPGATQASTTVPATASKKPSVLSWLMHRFGAAVAQDLVDEAFNEKDAFETGTDHHSHHHQDEASESDNENYFDGSDDENHEEHHDHREGEGSFLEEGVHHILPSKGPQEFHKSHLSRAANKSSVLDDSKKKATPGVKVCEARSKDTENSIEANKSKMLQHKALNIVEVLVKLINVLFPLFFLVLGILHIVRNGRMAYNYDDLFSAIVDEMTSAAITMWGIMFAAIAGQSLKAYATFRAERGIKLMSLEQLMHSQSFSSSIKQPLLLRRIDITSICLFILWALSPLTNQALQKMSAVVPQDQPQAVPITYLDMTIPSTNTNPYPFSINITEASQILYKFVLLSNSNVSASSFDTWHHPKVPILTSLTAYLDSNQTTNNEWIDNNGTWTYSSELGVPIEGPQGGGTTTFIFPSSYWLFDCDKPKVSTPSAFNKTDRNGPIFYPSPSLSLNMAYTGSGSYASEGFVQWASVRNYQDLVTPCNLTQSEDDDDCSDPGQATNSTQFIYSACFMKTIGIESHVTCDGDSGCVIDQARVVPDADFSYLPVSDYLVERFATSNDGFPTSIGEQYVANPGLALSSLEHNSYDSAEILALNATEFTRRMQTLWNSWYGVLYGQSSYVEKIDKNASVGVANGQYVPDGLIYKIQPAWLALYFFSILIVLLLAIADIIWEHKTVSPDFLGFASSVVRSNQRLSKELRPLSGMERTRAMADMTVMIQDINSTDSKEGKIALAPATSGSAKLTKARVYRS